MSVLEAPRILFRGEVTWDPIVTNNYDAFYDETTGESILPIAIDKVKAFRTAAIASVSSSGGNWNPYGTHRSTFYDTRVSGAVLATGHLTQDPFMAAAVDFTGMLVDLESFGAYSSQLFFDRMSLGVAGGYHISLPRSTRATARYINFARNPANNMIAGVASVVWQTSFAKEDGLHVEPFDSPMLAALRSALGGHDVLGLTVRFNAYSTIYFDDPTLSNGSPGTTQAFQSLQAKLEAGGFQPNPARSRLVGVLGLWRKGEPISEPGDRALLPAQDSPLGSAHVRLADASLTLDLSNTVPETSRSLAKQDLGPLSVVALDAATGESKQLGTLAVAQYDQAAYDASSGIVVMPLAKDLAAYAANRDIQITDATGKALLIERALRAIPASPNLYLDEGGTGTTAFQLYQRGAPASGAITVTVATMSSDGSTIEQTASATTDDHGALHVPFESTAPGLRAFVVVPPGSNLPSQGIDPQVDTYAYVRIRPADASIAALPPTWQNVYAHVLANWNAMAPCMDNWLELDDPVQIKAYAAVLKRLTDPKNFEAFRFMPVTRDMTEGERTLLYHFLDAPAALDTASKSAPPPELAHFAALSRSHRRG